MRVSLYWLSGRTPEREAMPFFMTLAATTQRGFSCVASYTAPVPPDAPTRLT